MDIEIVVKIFTVCFDLTEKFGFRAAVCISSVATFVRWAKPDVLDILGNFKKNIKIEEKKIDEDFSSDTSSPINGKKKSVKRLSAAKNISIATSTTKKIPVTRRVTPKKETK